MLVFVMRVELELGKLFAVVAWSWEAPAIRDACLLVTCILRLGADTTCLISSSAHLLRTGKEGRGRRQLTRRHDSYENHQYSPGQNFLVTFHPNLTTY